MTEVTLAGWALCLQYMFDHQLVAAQQFASNPQQKESKRLIIFTWLGETAPSMASADRRSLQRPRHSPSLCPLNFRTVLLLISLSVFLPATLRAQAPTVNRDSSSTTSSSSGSTQGPISQPAISQVQ